MREKCDHEILEMQRKHGHQMHRASEEASVRVRDLEKEYLSQIKTSVSVGLVVIDPFDCAKYIRTYVLYIAGTCMHTEIHAHTYSHTCTHTRVCACTCTTHTPSNSLSYVCVLLVSSTVQHDQGT